MDVPRRQTDQLRQSYREVLDQKNTLEELLDKYLAEQARQLPAVSVTKADLGKSWVGQKIDPDRSITIHPQKYIGPDLWRSVQWEISKGPGVDRLAPPITVEPLDVEKFKNLHELPRPHQRIEPGNLAWLFKNSYAEPVGWVNFQIGSPGSPGHLNFLGVVPTQEGQGYGGAILDWLKSHYDAFTLKPSAFPSDRIKTISPQKRLLQFYARNGFIYCDSGDFSWSKKDLNFEDLPSGGSLQVTTDFVADGTRYLASGLMRLYIAGLTDESHSGVLPPEEFKLAQSWIDLHHQSDRIISQMDQLRDSGLQ